MHPNSRPNQASSNKSVPLTPIHRLLCKLKLGRGAISLGKRGRDNPKGTVSSLPAGALNAAQTSDHLSPGEDNTALTSSSPYRPAQRARVALQQDDEPFDAIVITTLPCYPFCCHEDLLMMSRQQLIDVALTLNAHLPAAMKVEISEMLTDAHIRHAIETLLGIVPATPEAPKPVRSWPVNVRRKDKGVELPDSESDIDAQLDILSSTSASPLAMRISRRRGISLIGTPPRPLGRLDEEDEGSIFSVERPLKKRKVSHSHAAPTRFVYDHGGIGMDISPAFDRALDLASGEVIFSTLDDDGDFVSEFISSSPIAQRQRFISSCSKAKDYVVAKGGMLTTGMGDLSLDSVKNAEGEDRRMDIG